MVIVNGLETNYVEVDKGVQQGLSWDRFCFL